MLRQLQEAPRATSPLKSPLQKGVLDAAGAPK
jgi:hypothetical protein